MWLHSVKVAQLLRSVASLHTNQSRSYLNHLVVHIMYTKLQNLWTEKQLITEASLIPRDLTCFSMIIMEFMQLVDKKNGTQIYRWGLRGTISKSFPGTKLWMSSLLIY